MLIKVKELFKNLEENDIQYVVWKSLENINEALNGIGDIDILLDINQKQKAIKMLYENGFVEDIKSPAKVLEDLIVFRGFDETSGSFIMLHLHFYLRFGRKKYKEYRFPYEKLMLESYKRYRGVKILNDSFFIITRFLHAIIKKNYNDHYLIKLSEIYFKMKKFDKEFINSYLNKFICDDVINLINEIKIGNLWIMGNYYNNVSNGLDKLSPVNKHIIKVRKYNFIYKNIFINNKIIDIIFPRNKLNKSLDIVLCGTDGTGKTSVSKILIKNLKPIAKVKRIYLGRNRWSKINSIINILRTKKMMFFLGWIWPLTSTMELIIRYYIGKIYRKHGYIVIYDRSIIDILIKYKKNIINYIPLFLAEKITKSEADIKYYFYAKSDIIIKRKNNHTKDEINENHLKYLKHIENKYNKIDTSDKSINDISSIIIKEILNYTSRSILNES